MDLLNDHGRSRGVSSVLSPYNIPSNFPNNIVSPNPIRGTPLNNISEFKSGGFTMRKMSTNQNGDEDQNNNISELIAHSFNNWGSKAQRKETEEIDFSGQDNPILNLLNRSGANNEKKFSPMDLHSNSILSPDYKPRSLSINSSGWSLPPHCQITSQKGNSGWDKERKDSKADNLKEPRKNGEGRLIKVSSFSPSIPLKAPISRKKTMIDPPNTIKDSSPLMFPKFSAAFKPFKKRSLSVADSSPIMVNDPNGRKRDEKAARKLEEGLQQS